jgi:hypothetical protein
MANGSGSHATLNNGLPFRDAHQEEQKIVMMGYFFNRFDPNCLDRMDYSGKVDITGKFPSELVNNVWCDTNTEVELHTTVDFCRVWFGEKSDGTPLTRTFMHGDLAITWQAPKRNAYHGFGCNTYISITRNDGPQRALGNGQRLVSDTYGVWGTDDEFDDRNRSNKEGMRMLNYLDQSDFPRPLTLCFTYTVPSLNGASPTELRVVRWSDNKIWVPINAQLTNDQEFCKIVTDTRVLGTWYALGLGF